MIIKKFIFAIIAIVCVTCVYLDAASEGLAQNILRLHVIANSDTNQDQELKLKVRDALLEQSGGLFSDCDSPSQSMQVAELNIAYLEQIAKQTLQDNGSELDVRISTGNYHFPTKYYGNLALPAGNYDALRVEIGKAEGQNWWCVMFPPLCFIDAAKGEMDQESLKILEDNLTSEEFELITSGNLDEEQGEMQVTIKFKLIEALKNGVENVKTAFAGK